MVYSMILWGSNVERWDVDGILVLSDDVLIAYVYIKSEGMLYYIMIWEVCSIMVYDIIFSVRRSARIQYNIVYGIMIYRYIWDGI